MPDQQPEPEPRPSPEPAREPERREQPAAERPRPSPPPERADERLAGLARLESQLARAQQELAQARAERSRVELELAASQVAAEKQLPASLAHRLRGSTREELEADADELLAQFPQLAKAAPALRPDPAQGQQAVPEPAKGAAEGARLYAARHHNLKERTWI